MAEGLKNCDDDDPCTADACHPLTGACAHTLTPTQDPEVCDGVDNDCDGLTDDDPSTICPQFDDACVSGACVTVPTLTPGFVYVPAGDGWVGSPGGCPAPTGYPGACENEASRDDDELLHAVRLTEAFEIGAREVTQGAFAAATGYNPSHFGPNSAGAACGDGCPVERVSWYDAVAYANKRSADAGLPPCYAITNISCQDGTTAGSPAACWSTQAGGIAQAEVTLVSGNPPCECRGYRLPTENEWEVAARAGSLTPVPPSEGRDGSLAQTGCVTKDLNPGAIAWYCATAELKTHTTAGLAPNA